MKPQVIRQILSATKPPLSFHTSDGRVVYVGQPETVIVADDLIAIGPSANAGSITLLSPDHVVRVERAKQKPLQKVA